MPNEELVHSAPHLKAIINFTALETNVMFVKRINSCKNIFKCYLNPNVNMYIVYNTVLLQ